MSSRNRSRRRNTLRRRAYGGTKPNQAPKLTLTRQNAYRPPAVNLPGAAMPAGLGLQFAAVPVGPQLQLQRQNAYVPAGPNPPMAPRQGAMFQFAANPQGGRKSRRHRSRRHRSRRHR